MAESNLDKFMVLAQAVFGRQRLAPARGFDGPHGALPAALHARAAAGARALPPSLSIGGRELNGITMNIII